MAMEKRGDEGPLLEGVKMTLRKLDSLMATEGVRPIEAVGKLFNPHLHEAIDRVQGTGDRDLVIEEIRRGFMYGDKVLRPSSVKVELASRTERQSNN